MRLFLALIFICSFSQGALADCGSCGDSSQDKSCEEGKEKCEKKNCDCQGEERCEKCEKHDHSHEKKSDHGHHH